MMLQGTLLPIFARFLELTSLPVANRKFESFQAHRGRFLPLNTAFVIQIIRLQLLSMGSAEKPRFPGRDISTERPGLVTGQRFTLEHPLWGTLVGIKRAWSDLFLRYAFETKAVAP